MVFQRACELVFAEYKEKCVEQIEGERLGWPFEGWLWRVAGWGEGWGWAVLEGRVVDALLHI